MDLKQLNYIVVIAEEQNLTKAAERLFVSQSTLSLFLSKLEKELGLTLFGREKNRLSITPAGELYVETAKKILDMKKELYEKLHIYQNENTLNIGISSELMLQIFAKVFAKFKPLAPNFTVNVMEGRAVAILDKLHENKLDVAIIGRGEIIRDNRYHIQLMKKEEVWLLIPPNHPGAHAASANYDNPPVADMSLFSNESYSLAPRDTCDYQIAFKMFNDYHMNAGVVCELNSTIAQCRMVLQGLCLSVIPSYCIPRDMGLLVCRPDKPYYRYMLCLQRKDRRPSQDEKMLMNLLKDAYDHYYDI